MIGLKKNNTISPRKISKASRMRGDSESSRGKTSKNGNIFMIRHIVFCYILIFEFHKLFFTMVKQEKNGNFYLPM
jgi:hypothetical protein